MVCRKTGAVKIIDFGLWQSATGELASCGTEGNITLLRSFFLASYAFIITMICSYYANFVLYFGTLCYFIGYIAPELDDRDAGIPGCKADVYSLGVILTVMLSHTLGEPLEIVEHCYISHWLKQRYLPIIYITCSITL